MTEKKGFLKSTKLWITGVTGVVLALTALIIAIKSFTKEVVVDEDVIEETIDKDIRKNPFSAYPIRDEDIIVLDGTQDPHAQEIEFVGKVLETGGPQIWHDKHTRTGFFSVAVSTRSPGKVYYTTRFIPIGAEHTVWGFREATLDPDGRWRLEILKDLRELQKASQENP